MGRFDPLYTPEQKQAVAELICSTPEMQPPFPRDAVRAAAAGELDGLRPFAITLSAAQKVATDLRRERYGIKRNLRRERGSIDDRLEEAAKTQLSIAEHKLDRLYRKEKSQGLDSKGLEELKRVGLALREVHARKSPPASHTGRGARKAEPNGHDLTGRPSDLVTQMERDRRATPPTTNASTEERPEGAPQPGAATDTTADQNGRAETGAIV